jgi:hypothetical protein
MPAVTADHSSSANGVDLSGSLSAQTADSLRATVPAQQPSMDTRAAHAVETVVALVDAQASRAQGAASSVKLNFNFNGNDLAVRIEMANGVVHTQFRTDSPELRGAIASQWQASSPSSQNRDVTFLAPSFSGSQGQADAAPTSDRGAPQRRDSDDPEANTPKGAPPLPGKQPSPRTAASAAATPTSRHLRAFA